MLFCWTKGKMTVLGQKSGGSRTRIFIGLKMSRIILEAVLDCIFGAMSGCGAYVCFGVWERDVELFESR